MRVFNTVIPLHVACLLACSTGPAARPYMSPPEGHVLMAAAAGKPGEETCTELYGSPQSASRANIALLRTALRAAGGSIVRGCSWEEAVAACIHQFRMKSISPAGLEFDLTGYEFFFKDSPLDPVGRCLQSKVQLLPRRR